MHVVADKSAIFAKFMSYAIGLLLLLAFPCHGIFRLKAAQSVLEPPGLSQGPFSPRGVVCPTFLHQRIRDENVKPWVAMTGVNATGFVAETERLCGGSAGPDAASYTGSWDDHSATQNDVNILQGLTLWTRLYGRPKSGTDDGAATWDDMVGTESDGDPYIRNLAGRDLAARTTSALDFGCGSGNDLTGIKKEFGLAKDKCLCLDIFEVQNENVLPITLTSTSDEAYNQSLESALAGREGSVDIAISVVTFHHIPAPRMKRDALTFLHRILAPGGIFVLREWANQDHPNLWIYFDLNHWMPNMLYDKGSPTSPEMLPQNTEYLDWPGYKAIVENSGLIFDQHRSPDPARQVEEKGNADRNFEAVFRKST